MKALLLGSMAIAVTASATTEDVKIALLGAAVVMIPTVGFLIREAIQLQTARLISARRNIETERQAEHALPEEETS